MKILISKLFFISAAIMLLGSCKKDQATEYYEGGTAPVLTASASDSIFLSSTTKSNTAVVFSWTNPNYMFASGGSSQNVSYLLEIDTLGANFTSPNKISYAISSDLGITFLDSALNSDLANRLLLAVDAPHTIQVRLTASIGTATVTKLVSNVLQFTVTPWSPPPAVNPPASGELYIVGSATLSWDNPVDDPSVQQFTQVSPTEYQLVTPLIGDGEYKFISVNGSWDADKQWSIKTEQNSGDASTLSYALYPNGGNVRAPQQSGTYLIVVNFQTGNVTLTKQ